MYKKDFSTKEITSILNQIDFSWLKNYKDELSATLVEEDLFFSEQFKILKNNGIDIRFGVSKLVFIPDNYDFVIKIPFYGDIDPEEGEFIPFSMAPYKSMSSISTGCDYCYSEVQFYDMAIDWGIEDFFCETFFFSEIEGFKIYISEKAIVSDDTRAFVISEKEQKTLRQTMEKNNIHNCFSLGFVSELLKNGHSIKEIRKFFNFLRLFNINDLHADNYGRTLSGAPIIIDYSGFYG